MGFLDKIIKIIYRKVKIKKTDIIDLLDATDVDSDGYISLPEIWSLLKRLS